MCHVFNLESVRNGRSIGPSGLDDEALDKAASKIKQLVLKHADYSCNKYFLTQKKAILFFPLSPVLVFLL